METIRLNWEDLPTYDGADLGASYTNQSTTFKLWAPTAEAVTLQLYPDGGDGETASGQPQQTLPMTKDAKTGVYAATFEGDAEGLYYTYCVDGRETGDPYAKACGVNGLRSMVIDLGATDPEGFALDKGPRPEHYTDAIIYETSVADMTSHETWGGPEAYRGKFLGLAQSGTKNKAGYPTGLDYIRDLGVTHVQIMPSYDFGSVDERKSNLDQYNWGYDPVNYNCPEGSFATDAYDGHVRVREMKQMIAALHAAGLCVNMDVVYNHTYDIAHSVFQNCVPDYYYGADEKGYTDGSACGNEIASSRTMVRKYIVDSVTYWASEYHIDGFRFDLMGVLDLKTMQQIEKEIHEIDPRIMLYGEGWLGGSSALAEEQQSKKSNIKKLKGIAAFSDDMRDGVRGHVFYEKETGFISGKADQEKAMRFNVAGAGFHPQVDYASYTYTPEGAWAKNPCDVINYISCHDNLTLYDKLAVSRPDFSHAEILKRSRLGAFIIETSQGIPFLLSGEEFGRTKPVEGSDKPCENSFNMPHYTNDIHYDFTVEQMRQIAYYKGLFAMRKEHPLFRLSQMDQVQEKLTFLNRTPKDVVAFTLRDETEDLLVVYNASEEDASVSLYDDDRDKEFVTPALSGALYRLR